jgi:hypothetical protein
LWLFVGVPLFVNVWHLKQKVWPSVYSLFASDEPHTGHGMCLTNSDPSCEPFNWDIRKGTPRYV